MKRTNRMPLGVVAAAVLATSWVASPVRAAIPPDPDNAALLYYQAFLTIADLDKEARDHIGDVARGKLSPDEKTREYVERCQGAIDFAEAAQGLQVCHWGFRYSQGFEALMPYLAQMRFLAHVLLADARIRAADGDYRSSLERCLMMGPLSRHVGDDTLVSYLVSVAIQRQGYERMDEIVGQAAGDVELLQWLQGELATLEKAPAFPITALKIEREICLATMTKENIDKMIQALADPNNEKLLQILAAADESTLAEARRFYADTFNSALTILASSLPYEQAHRQLEQLARGGASRDTVTAVAHAMMPALVRVITVKTTQEAHANAVRAAVEICLQKARTGSLPSTLPAGLPKDPFSGRDFLYERTTHGFVLRCQGKDLVKDTILEFEFAVK